MKITIIGNGQIGQAIIYLLNKSEKKHTIEVYDKDNSKNESHKTLKECLNGTNFIFLCVPSWCLKETLKKISENKIDSQTILISLSKGINASSKESADEMIEKNIKKAKYALLSGPMVAKEILKNEMSFAILASKDKKVFEKVSKLFEGTKLKLEYSKNVRSVAFSGILKNIYTFAISIISNSPADDNLKGFLSAKAIKEMKQIMAILGLDKKIIVGTSGLGDFIATLSSKYSQNKKVGIDISTKGGTFLKSEGLISLPPLISIIGKKYKKLPMLYLLEKVILEKKDSKTEVNNFLKEI
ncbi:MAG: NAD(P)-binding domain-containing protein [Patescibacteria group bacterium]